MSSVCGTGDSPAGRPDRGAGWQEEGEGGLGVVGGPGGHLVTAGRVLHAPWPPYASSSPGTICYLAVRVIMV